MERRNVRVLTEKDMEGSKHKSSSMSEFDKLLEVCRVASELYDQEHEENNIVVMNLGIRGSVDKSWERGLVSTPDQESNKIVMFTSTTCRISGEELFEGGRKKSRGETSSSYRYYEYANVTRSWGDHDDDQVVTEKVLGNKRKPYYWKDENFVYPDELEIKEKVPGKKRKCYDEDSEYSEKKEKKPRRSNKARNKVVETTAPLPVEFANEIQRLGGNDVRLLIQKELTNTDLAKDKNRLSMPYNQVREEAKGFLTEAENEFLDKRNAEGKRIEKMQVPLLEPSLNRSLIDFKKWDMNTSFWYVLCGPWSATQTKNHLQAGKDIQVWSFRVNGDLNLALVKIPQVANISHVLNPRNAAVVSSPDQPKDGNED